MSKALSENPDHLHYLCSRLNIGSRRGELGIVYGGFHHRMWRLETDCGTYAIKQLAANTDLGDTNGTNHFNIAESVAEEFAKRGIAAVFALRHNTDYLQVFEDAGYLVYPWTDAVALDKNSISEQHAQQVAGVLARMHCANIVVPALKTEPFDTHSEDKIIFLVQQAVDCQVKNALELKQQLPNFLNMVEKQKAAIGVLEQHVVVSHGDLDHKNVLWGSADIPLLIDWESARKLNPTYEILLEAFDWSGITGNFNHGLLETFISAYTQAGGVLEGSSLQASYDCILGDWLSWLMYNVGRAIDPDDGEERVIGSAQVQLSLSTLLRLGHLLPWLQDK